MIAVVQLAMADVACAGREGACGTVWTVGGAAVAEHVLFRSSRYRNGTWTVRRVLRA